MSIESLGIEEVIISLGFCFLLVAVFFIVHKLEYIAQLDSLSTLNFYIDLPYLDYFSLVESL